MLFRAQNQKYRKYTGCLVSMAKEKINQKQVSQRHTKNENYPAKFLKYKELNVFLNMYLIY